MKLKTIVTTNLYKTASQSASLLSSIPKNKEIKIIGSSIQWEDATPFVKVKYNSQKGFVKARLIKGLYLKQKSTNNKKYPVKAIISDSTNRKKKQIKIPQQKQFGSYCSSHGCSVTAVSIALQLLNISESPSEVYSWAKSNLSGYNSSKLSIYGCEQAINGISKKSNAMWKPYTGSNKSDVKNEICKAVNNGYFVLFEQKNPIHTNIIIGRDVTGKYVVASNGKIKKVTLNSLMRIALTDKNKTKANWWKSNIAGYVIVKP